MEGKSIQKKCCKYRKHGEGTMYRTRTGKIRVQLVVDNKRISKSLNSWLEAENWIKKIKEKQSVDTLASLTSEYLEDWSSLLNIRPRTIYQYKSLIHKHIIPNIGYIPLVNLRIRDIDCLYKKLLEENVGIRTINLIQTVLHSAFEKAVRNHYISENPTVGANVPHYSHREMKFLSPEEVRLFLENTKGSPEYAFYYLAISTGMRLGELIGLKWENINFSEGYINLQRQIQCDPEAGNAEKDLKTKYSHRIIELSDGTITILKGEIEKQKIAKAFAGKKWIENGLVFPNTVGNPRDQNIIRKKFYRI
jgi:integrase